MICLTLFFVACSWSPVADCASYAGDRNSPQQAVTGHVSEVSQEASQSASPLESNSAPTSTQKASTPVSKQVEWVKPPHATLVVEGRPAQVVSFVPGQQTQSETKTKTQAENQTETQTLAGAQPESSFQTEHQPDEMLALSAEVTNDEPPPVPTFPFFTTQPSSSIQVPPPPATDPAIATDETEPHTVQSLAVPKRRSLTSTTSVAFKQELPILGETLPRPEGQAETGTHELELTNPFEELRGSLPEVSPRENLQNDRRVPAQPLPTEAPYIDGHAQVPQQIDPRTENPIWVAKIKFPALRYVKQTELSLEDAIQHTIHFAPEIAILQSEVGIREAEIARQQANFNWNSFVESSWDERNIPVGSQLEGVTNRLVNHRLANELGLLKRNQLGGNLRLAQALGIEDSNSQFFTPQNQGTARLALEYQQPLIQGAGRLVNTSLIAIAVANASASQDEFVGGLQSHILDVVTAYWELVARRGELVVLQESYARAQETAAIIANRVHLDINPVQSARSEARLAQRRTAVMNAEYAVVFAQERLLRLIFGPFFRQSVDTEIIPTSEMLGPLRRVDMELELQSALQNRPEVRRTIQFIKRSSVEQGVARNQLLPVLGLTLSLSNQGLRGDRDLGGAINDQWSVGEPTYGVGLAYAFPIGNRAAKANWRQANLRLVQFQKQLEKVVADVALEVRNATHNIEFTGNQREATRSVAILAGRELSLLQTRTELLVDGADVGAVYLENLFDTQDRLARAELGFVNSSADHALAQFELQRSTGSLLISRPLPVEASAKPIWPHRAPLLPSR